MLSIKNNMSCFLSLILLCNVVGCSAQLRQEEVAEDFQKKEQAIQWIADFPKNSIFVGQLGKYVAFRQDKSIYIYDKSEGSVLLLGEYENVFFNAGIITCVAEDNITNFNVNGELLANTLFSTKYHPIYTDELTPRKLKDGVFGYVNYQDIWIIKPQFSYAEPFSDGYAYVEKDEGKTCGFIDSDNQFWTLCVQDGVARENRFHEDRLLVSTYGNIENEVISTYITSQNEILPSSMSQDQMVRANYPYQEARNFHEGMAAVQFQEKWGYINHDGKLQISPKYQNASSYSAGLAAVERTDGMVGVIDREGNEIGDFRRIDPYSFTGEYHDGLYMVRGDNGKSNLVDQNGKFVLQQDSTYVYWTDPFWYVAQDRLSQSVYLANIEKLIPAYKTQAYSEDKYIFESASTLMYDSRQNQLYSLGATKGKCSEGLIVCKGENDRFGFVNVYGEWVIPPVFVVAEDFSNGVAFVANEERNGLISNPLRYHGAWSRDAVERGQAFNLENQVALGGETINYKQFLDMLYSGYKGLQNISHRDESAVSVDDSLMRDQLPAVLGFPDLNENSKATKGDVFNILFAFARLMGQSVDYCYYAYENSNNIESSTMDSIAYLSSIGIVNSETVKEVNKEILVEEGMNVVVLFFEAISA